MLLHSRGFLFGESRHWCLLSVEFWEFAFWSLRFEVTRHWCHLRVVFCVYAFWGLHFGESLHRCFLGNPYTDAFWGFWVFWILGVSLRGMQAAMPFAGCILGILHYGGCVTGKPDIVAFWGLNLAFLHSGVFVSGNPNTDGFWGLHFGYFAGCLWVFAFWGPAFLKLAYSVQSYRCVRCLTFPQSTSHFFVAEACQSEAELSSG